MATLWLDDIYKPLEFSQNNEAPQGILENATDSIPTFQGNNATDSIPTFQGNNVLFPVDH